MVRPSFEPVSWSRLGEIVDWLAGPTHTEITFGPFESKSFSLITTPNERHPPATISCQRETFRTRHYRWWIPTTVRNLYHVSIAVEDSLKTRYGADLFAPRTFPLLCNRLLKWTTYPHICAIEAYLDDVQNAIEQKQSTE